MQIVIHGIITGFEYRHVTYLTETVKRQLILADVRFLSRDSRDHVENQISLEYYIAYFKNDY